MRVGFIVALASAIWVLWSGAAAAQIWDLRFSSGTDQRARPQPPTIAQPWEQSGALTESERGDRVGAPVFIVWSEGRIALPRAIVFPAETRVFPELDHDGDGYVSAARGGDDCDDDDRTRHPGALEIADRLGHDEDCDIRTIGVQDEDGDGFTSWRAMAVVRDREGEMIGVLRGPDCDDANAEIHPRAREVRGDQRDNDCDGLTDVRPRRSGLRG